MNIFLAIVMGPGLGFMVYALCQFWLEERRLRRQRPAGSPRHVTLVTSVEAVQREPVWRRRADDARVVLITQPLSHRSAGRHVA
jgi:hypothetical protein